MCNALGEVREVTAAKAKRQEAQCHWQSDGLMALLFDFQRSLPVISNQRARSNFIKNRLRQIIDKNSINMIVYVPEYVY
jgi:hypothetical protein